MHFPVVNCVLMYSFVLSSLAFSALTLSFQRFSHKHYL